MTMLSTFLFILSVLAISLAHASKIELASFHDSHNHGFEHKLRHGRKLPAEIPTETRHLRPNPIHHTGSVKISWDDERLQAYLWRGIRGPGEQLEDQLGGDPRIAKRVTPRYTVMKSPRRWDCLACATKSITGKTLGLDQLTVDYLRQQIIQTEEQLKDKCVFYSGLLPSERIAFGDVYLSGAATRFACNNNKYTIWNLYPGDSEVTDENKSRIKNFWEVHEAGSWLNYLELEGTKYTYFERMSTAMAQVCTGDIIIMTFNARFLHKYGKGDKPFEDLTAPDGRPWLEAYPDDKGNNTHSIWNNFEFPTLDEFKKTTKITCYEVSPGGLFYTIYPFDMGTGEVIFSSGTTRRSEVESWSGDNSLGKRDACTQNLQYQPRWEDWFGTGSDI